MLKPPINLTEPRAEIDRLARSLRDPRDAELFVHLGIRDEDVEVVQPDSIALPFSSILANLNDMTPTLERLTGSRTRLAVLRWECHHNVLFRQVLLSPDQPSSLPLVLGNIKIALKNLPEKARRFVLEGTIPFGTILREENILHRNSFPEVFRIRLSNHMAACFGKDPGESTYGRCRRMIGRDDALLGHVLEVVSPRILSALMTGAH
jgi:chorismate-pyruvate lyase